MTTKTTECRRLQADPNTSPACMYSRRICPKYSPRKNICCSCMSCAAPCRILLAFLQPKISYQSLNSQNDFRFRLSKFKSVEEGTHIHNSPEKRRSKGGQNPHYKTHVCMYELVCRYTCKCIKRLFIIIIIIIYIYIYIYMYIESNGFWNNPKEIK